MRFNAPRAHQLLRQRDRDDAPFFAGRQVELERFDDALAEVGGRREHDNAATFLVYQGAPGCGKTSLMHHLRRERSEGVLFVPLDLHDLGSADALTTRVLGQAVESGSLGSRVGAKVADVLGSRLQIQEAAKDLSNYVAFRAAKGTTVVLHLDEAQEIGPSERAGLLKLHTTGLAVPSLFVMTGLAHTTQRLGSIGGLSRLSSDAIVNMGTMAEAECVESTRLMLDDVGAVGTEAERLDAAATLAALAYGWPHHLRGGQRALCRELIRTSGTLREVDAERLRRESERNRHEYYLGRLDHPVLAKHRPVTVSIIAQVSERRPASLAELGRLCRQEMDGSGWSDLADQNEFAEALVEKGAVSIGADGRCEVPIPSMAEWAASWEAAA